MQDDKDTVQDAGSPEPPDEPDDGLIEMPPTVVLEGGLRPGSSLTTLAGSIPREIPVRLGKYTIDRQLGWGAMGVVYLAHQDDLNRPVALKLLLRGEQSSEGQQQRFDREARAIARLRHPNIVSVHEVGDYQGQSFFTMDYVDGLALDAFIQANHITSTSLIADLTATIADAVQYAHENGIVHRDLKPGNILVDRSGKPVITDFGLAKDMDAGTMFSVAGDVMGTPAYMAPEQAEGQVANTGEHSDVYSLGAILYALLTGKPPFEGKTLVETLGRVIHDDPYPLAAANPKVEGELGAICMKAMEKDPGLRYPSAGDMADDLRRFINGYPVHAKPWTVRRAVQKFRRRHRKELRITTAAAVVVVIVGFITPALFSRSYLDIARTHLASTDAVVRADTAATLAREISAPEQLDAEDRAEAIALLVGEVAGHDPETLLHVLEFLGAHGGESAISAALTEPIYERIKVLAGDNQHPDVRDAAIRALGAIRQPGLAQFLVDRMQRETNPAIRLKLVRALGEQGSMQAIGPLMNLVAHDPICRAEAQAALDRTFGKRRLSLFGGQDTQIKDALQGLTDAMAQHDRQIEDVMNALEGPPVAERHPGPYGAYQRVLDQGTQEEQIQAVHELRRTGETDTVPILLALLGHESRYVGAAAAMAIAELDPLGAGDELRRLLRTGPAPVRRDAALALGFTHQRQNVDLLLVALAEEPILETAEEILFALGELRSPDARPGLEEAARRDPRLRAGAEAALARLAR